MCRTKGYVSVPAQYIGTKAENSTKDGLLENEGCRVDYVQYIFFNKLLEDTNDDEVKENIIKTCLRGKIENFYETEVPLNREKDPMFFEYISKLLLKSGDSALIFGEGRQLIQTLMVRPLKQFIRYATTFDFH